MRRTIRKHHFAHDNKSVLFRAIGVGCNGLQNAIRSMTFSLLRGTTVKPPFRKLFQCRKAIELFDESLAADVGNGLVTVEPDVFKFALRHYSLPVNVYF